MEHLDPDEEDEEGEASASANIRNKAINALLGGSAPLSGPSPRNQAGPETDDDDSDGDERTPGVSEILKYIYIIDMYVSLARGVMNHRHRVDIKDTRSPHNYFFGQ